MLNIRETRRTTLNITQAELARLLGVDQATVSRAEKAQARGKAVDQRTILAVEALVARQAVAA